MKLAQKLRQQLLQPRLIGVIAVFPIAVVFPRVSHRNAFRPTCVFWANLTSFSLQPYCRRLNQTAATLPLALDVKVILTLYISLVVLYGKYTGWCDSDFNVCG
jgi:hypothetical protein